MAPIVYREEMLHPALADWISCAWTYERTYGLGDIETVVPDGMVELVIQLGASYFDADVPLPSSVAIGTLHRPLSLTATGDVRAWCVRFPWWGLAPFGDVSAFGGLQWAPAREIFDAGLVADIEDAAKSEHPVEGFNRALLSHLLAWTTAPDTLRTAGRAIAHHAASVTVEELATACSSSERKLQRDFRRVLDATPVQMIARVRFERARRLIIDKNLPLAAVAAEAGYADQPHLNRSFMQFAGMTPGEYRDQFQRAVTEGGDVGLIQD